MQFDTYNMTTISVDTKKKWLHWQLQPANLKVKQVINNQTVHQRQLPADSITLYVQN